MEARSHCDTAGAHGIKETIVTVQNLLETRLHGDTMGNHEIKEPLVTQRGRLEAMVHCSTADSRRPWGQHGTSWNPPSIGTQRGLMDTRGPLWQSRASWKHGEHCDIVGNHGSMESIVPLRKLMEPRRSLGHNGSTWNQGSMMTLEGLMEHSIHCDTARPRGSKEPL